MSDSTLTRLSALLTQLFARDVVLRGDERFREDLGLDSIDLVRLQVEIEDAWDIRFDPISDDLAGALTNVQAMVFLINDKYRGGVCVS